MITLPGYKILSQLYSGKAISVYRAIWLEKNIPVVLKILTDEYPSQEDVSRLKHEYNLIKDLTIPDVIRVYKLDKIGHRYALVLEDVQDSITLSEYLENKKINIDLFLIIALQMTQVLHELHTAHVIHKDINPNNIIITKKNNKIKLIDFSIATELSQEIMSPEGLEGMLAYISPEQTARMNRVLDRRTDLYSLGIVFYLMLTGQLPFEAKDPLEWVYSHIAKRPKSPKELNPEIPDVISNIVMKLLAKAPEDRYSTAYGLAEDLEYFMAAWQKKGEAISFTLGEKDRTSLFQIPQKLYGREIEIEQLMAAFSRISKGSREILFVRGYSGIGKTSLINEIHKPIVRQHGYFISGKFEQFQQNIPYYGLIQAFRKLIQQLLTESQNKISTWKDKLLKALSPNAQLIIEVIPEVEWLIGKQPPVQKLPPSEAQNRFELVFFDFVQTFCQLDHPIVIFLDDLQWADLASLELIKKLLKDGELKYLLMIGSYRDNEVNPGHPLIEMIENLEKASVPLEILQVKPLSFDNVKQLIRDTLNTTVEIDQLAELVFAKTGGNPFFCNTFLMMLHEEHYITFDIKRGKWLWDISTLQGLTITDNVVDLLITKIGKLPTETQDVLRIAACIGNQFDLKTLAIVSEKSLNQTAKALWPALQENLVIPLSSGYKLIMADPDYALQKESILYKFSHDRIQQAADEMLTPEQHDLIHLKLGRLMLANLSSEELEERIFEVANHFNKSAALLTKSDERFEVAKLNIRAGDKAKASIAYQSAADYFEYAITFLGEDAWKIHYSETFQSHLAYAELIHLLGKFSEANTLFSKLIDRAVSPLDKARILMFLTISYGIQAEWEKSVDAGLKGLQFLGVNLKKYPSTLRITMELFATLRAMRRINSETILNEWLETKRPEDILILDFFERVGAAAYNTADSNLVAQLVFRAVLYSLKNGYTQSTAVTLAGYAVILVAAFSDFDQGYKLGKLSMQMVDQFEDLRARTRVYCLCGIALFPWKIPYRECLVIVNKAYMFGRQGGELLYSNYAALAIPGMMIFQGDELDDIKDKIKNVSSITEFTNFSDSVLPMKAIESFILVLKGEKPQDDFDEKAKILFNNTIPFSNTAIVAVGPICLIKFYLFENFDQAVRLLDKLLPYMKLDETKPTLNYPEYYFLDALIKMSLYEKQNFLQKIRYRIAILSSLQKFKKFAKSCPANFESRYQLMLGGWLQITGRQKKALLAYDRAISVAREYGLTSMEAMANEFIGRMCSIRKLYKHAKLFIQEAALVYQRWGAGAKVQLLQERYPEFFLQMAPPSSNRTVTITRHDATITSGKVDLDFSSVMKSVQLISSNVLLEELLRSFIKIAMEQTNANSCLLLLEKDNEFVVVAESNSENKEIKISNDQSSHADRDLFSSLIQYVQQTQEAVLLMNASQESAYAEDPYVLKHKPLSIICLPVVHKGHVIGILYLENNSMAGAFTHKHLDMLRLVTGQAAISLQNSQLFLASDRFVPHEFLDILGKHSIVDIHIGDHIQKEMTVLFCGVRGYSGIAGQLTPEENFNLINEYLGYMEPVIQEHGGFVDKFIGDSIMVLFPGEVDSAVLAGIAMQEAVERFNQVLSERKENLLRVGIGLNSGKLILGTLGAKSRMETSVISDAVNISSRIEELAKEYDCRFLISGNSYQALKDASQFQCRFIDKLKVRGRANEIEVWEVYSADPEALRYQKVSISVHYERAIKLFYEGSYPAALQLFNSCAQKLSNDKIILMYIKRCEKAIANQPHLPA